MRAIGAVCLFVAMTIVGARGSTAASAAVGVAYERCLQGGRVGATCVDLARAETAREVEAMDQSFVGDGAWSTQVASEDGVSPDRWTSAVWAATMPAAPFAAQAMAAVLVQAAQWVREHVFGGSARSTEPMTIPPDAFDV